MSSIMDLNALRFVEFGGASSRVRVPNNIKINQFLCCFFNPNILLPKCQSRPLTTVPYSSLHPHHLPSFRRDCAQRLRVRAATTKDDIGESSGETKQSDLRANMSPLHPHYIESGLIYYKVLVQCCAICSMLKKSSIPEWAKKDTQSCFRRIIERFSIDDVKKIRKITNHDHGKAVEHFLKEKCRSHPHVKLVLEYLNMNFDADDFNILSRALMFVEAIKIFKFHVLSDLIDDICYLSLMDDTNGFGTIASCTSTSKTLLAKCAVGLSKEMLRISGVETKLMEKYKLTNAVRNYLNHEEDEVRWSKIKYECGSSVYRAHGYMIELFSALKQFNNILMPLGRHTCECLSCYEFKPRHMTPTTATTTWATMHIDDFENIQENLRLANEYFENLISVPHLKFSCDMSMESMRDMAIGFEHSLMAYRSILRGIILFRNKFCDARYDKLENIIVHPIMRKSHNKSIAILRKLTQMGQGR